jgi:hypothetical protein
VRNALQRDGFSIRTDDKSGSAFFEWHSLVCATFWVVSWRVGPDDKAEGIRGDSSLSCL